MNFLNPPGTRVVKFSKGRHVFEVFKQQTSRGESYLGYHDGRLSVVASQRDAATRMLLARHMGFRRADRQNSKV